MPLGTPINSGGGGADVKDPFGMRGNSGGQSMLSQAGSALGTYNNVNTALTTIAQYANSYKQANAQNQWAQNQVGLINSGYNMQLNAINGYSYAGGSGAAAARAAGIANERARSDYAYGVKLRDQQEYRDVTLGGQRNDNQWWAAQQAWNILQDDVASKRGTTKSLWNELQRYNTEQYGFADRGRDLDLDQADFDYNRDKRLATSDATARGARTSSGFQDTLRELTGERDLTIRGTELKYDKTIAALENELATGKINFDQAMAALDVARRRGQVEFKTSKTNYGINKKELASLAKTFGIQDDKALADLNFALRQSAAGVAAARSSDARAAAQAASQAALARAQIEAARLRDLSAYLPMYGQYGPPSTQAAGSAGASGVSALSKILGRMF